MSKVNHDVCNTRKCSCKISQFAGPVSSFISGNIPLLQCSISLAFITFLQPSVLRIHHSAAHLITLFTRIALPLKVRAGVVFMLIQYIPQFSTLHPSVRQTIPNDRNCGWECVPFLVFRTHCINSKFQNTPNRHPRHTECVGMLSK